MTVHSLTVTRLDEDRFQASCQCGGWTGDPLERPGMADLAAQFDNHIGVPQGTNMQHWQESADGG